MNNIDIEGIDQLMQVQLRSCTVGDDNFNYMQGIYNGMEIIRNTITGEEPIFLESNGVLNELAVERNPERYV